MTSTPTVADGTKTFRQIGYEPGFDGIRGTGAVLAVFAHASMVVLPEPDQRGMPELLSGIFVVMDAFFVLSGFLITALLLKEQQRTGRIKFLAFYRRRAFRLIPALWVLLIVHFIYASIVNYDMQIERETIWSVSTFTLNFRMDNMLTARVATGLTQLWSLSMEEQFYLIWPLLIMVLLPLKRRLRTTVIILVTAIIAISIRRYLLWADGADWLRLYTHTDTRADSLLVGALLACLWVHGKTPKKYVPAVAWVATAFIGWGLFYLRVNGGFATKGGYNLLAIAWAVVLLATLDGRWGLTRVISSRPFLALGKVSYGIYLWHVPIMFAVADHARDQRPMVRLALSLIILAVAVVLSWKFVEEPMLRYKDRRELKPNLRDRGRSTVVAVAPPEGSPTADGDQDPGLDTGAETAKA